jgi:hypothetical protein
MAGSVTGKGLLRLRRGGRRVPGGRCIHVPGTEGHGRGPIPASRSCAGGRNSRHHPSPLRAITARARSALSARFKAWCHSRCGYRGERSRRSSLIRSRQNFRASWIVEVTAP